jgi:hypothetical protein
MTRKNKTILILSVLFVVITAGGFFYTGSVQRKSLNEKDAKLTELRASFSSLEHLKTQVITLEKKVASVDSMLFSGKYIIPKNLGQSDFFNFIDKYSRDNTLVSFSNTEFLSKGVENGFNYYLYKVSGTGTYTDVYALIYAIEQSKELKKVQSGEITGTTTVDADGIPHYQAKFVTEIRVYYSPTDQYSSLNYSENDLFATKVYDAFYPLIRNEIRPNIDDLPDVQDGALISLVPQGAFVMDSKGETYLMEKGDQVYLGYLMDIDYKNESVTFILNKGGIVEYQVMKIGDKLKKEGRN